MNYEEFLKPTEETNEPEMVVEAEEPAETTEPTIESDVELDVQKAVVESLAADKAEQDEHIRSLRKDNDKLRSELSTLKGKIDEMKGALEKVGELLSKNAEGTLSTKVTVLERSAEVEDRFEGETRDHVLEALKAARDAAEADGRLRQAQILEAVLSANEPTGELAKRREKIEKLFADNQNILSGPVINELDKLGITYKIGENYLLAKEIIKRSY